MSADLYSVLGLSPSASAHEIRSAFRRLARTLHPDLHGSDPSRDRRFAQVVAAYEVLGDPVRRAAYDRERIAPATPTGGKPELSAEALAQLYQDVQPYLVPLMAAGLLRLHHGVSGWLRRAVARRARGRRVR